MKTLTKLIQQHFDTNMQQHNLYRVELSGREVWDLYMDGFTTKTNPIFRDPESSSHNCNHCKNFVRRYGNIVAIDENNNLITLFDIEIDGEYSKSMKKMSKAISKSKIANIFTETFKELKSLPYEACKKNQAKYLLGTPENHKKYTEEEAKLYGVVKAGEIRTFNHFSLNIPKKFVDQSGNSAESIMGNHRSSYDVFYRGMEEISLDTLNLVKDLINQGSLLNGDTHLHKIMAMIPLKEAYDELPKKERKNWCWAKSFNFQFAKFRNELIGVLCTELSEGEDLSKACLNWNKRVDPANYMKATAPITKKQIKEAQKFVEENGYEESFNRRFATMDDIKASEILHMSVGDGKIKKVSIFDEVKSSKKGRHSRANFDNVESITIDKFMSKVLPEAKSLEVYLENKHTNNMMSLITAATDDSKPIFKYPNNYSQTFKGNLAGKSEIKDNVNKVGGNIVALLRCSLQWNDKDTPGIVDFDLHARGKNHIYYPNNGQTHSCGGHLDVDMIRPHKIGIENITWKRKIDDGKYVFSVKNYCGGNNTGFKIEIEMGDEVYNYSVSKNVRGVEKVATVTVKGGEFSIEHHLPETNSSREIYGLETKNFHKVNLLCLSPNHWGNASIGDKYFLFLLDNCKVDKPVRSFHNVDLLPELQKHRKVLEVLGNTNMIEPTDSKQLCGVGFNSTVKDELLVKVKGSHNRMLKVTF